MEPKTLLRLAVDGGSVFDGSVKGVGVVNAERAKVQGGVLRLQQGGLEFARHSELDALQVFTISVSVTPEQIGTDRRNIVEGQHPAIALFVDANGRVNGLVNTASGWVGVDSGATVLRPNQTAQIRFWRDESGTLALEIDGRSVGTKAGVGAIVNVGPKGLFVGSGADGTRWPFVGKISELLVQQGVVTSQWLSQKQSLAAQIQSTFTQRTGLTRVVVNLLPDASRAKLQPIKDIMNAAGVQRLSDLDALKITKPTTMTPGKVMVAPRKMAVLPVNWAAVATQFVAAATAQKRTMLATILANRNSAAVLARATTPVAPQPGAGEAVSTVGTTPLTPSGRIVGIGGPERTSLRVPAEVLRANPTLAIANRPTSLAESVSFSGGALRLINTNLVRDLSESNPAKWPVTSPTSVQLMSLQTIPVDSAVIIAGTLDLTDTKLVVEPNVETLYIIAEQIVCGNNATITWRKPGGTTPARADNPDLSGRGWSGIQTKPNSRDGLDGEDGSAGGPGIDGRGGNHAPKLEIWVKDLSAVPNIDLNGEDGLKGGKGQRGGSGGNGADGQFGVHGYFLWWDWCDTQPGDGGNGGNGGNGGRGGNGGNAGNGGKITIGVLEGTLQSTVTNRAFKIKNQAGQLGRGGGGGDGGLGGRGGRSGVGQYCKDAHDGVNGAQGQPGPAGADAASTGYDGEIQFFEFTQEAWDELLTRPWISEVAPVQAFPGDRLTLRGSRFSSNDRVVVGTIVLTPTINADESISATLPLTIPGGIKLVFVRRQDGTESNRMNIWIKPQLDPLPALSQGADATLTGRAFVSGASVLVNGTAIPAELAGPTQVKVSMPGTGGAGSGGGDIIVQVRNPDGMLSNSRTATLPQIREIPFRFGKHNLAFANFTDGVPDWGTYEDTFGSAEVWHELLDPIFGHPILTYAYFEFYKYFLKGTANGGLATGFCTSMSALVADRLWQGFNDTPTITKPQVHKQLTAIHGRLLSRESLLTFHDQGRAGVSRVERTARDIESAFLRGVDRFSAPMVFFIPSGDIWDSGYFARLGSSHCVMPYRFVYPKGRPAPQLTPDGLSTTTDFDGVELYVWDCNHPRVEDQGDQCKLRFRRTGGQIHFDYLPGGSTTPEFASEQGITLGMMTNGDYHLADHDLPFGGPFGLTTFIVDFLLSPAELQVTSGTGLRTGNFGGQILSEIPDSHPCYLVKGAYLLPPGTALTRRIFGTGAGKYSFNTIMPEGVSIALEGVDTLPGQEDVLSINADASQIRFTPAVDKPISFTVCRMVGNQARALAVTGMAAGPAADIDITLSPDLSLLRMGNRGGARTNVEVRAYSTTKGTQAKANKQVAGITVPANHDLTVAVPDWQALNVTAEAVPFA